MNLAQVKGDPLIYQKIPPQKARSAPSRARAQHFLSSELPYQNSSTTVNNDIYANIHQSITCSYQPIKTRSFSSLNRNRPQIHITSHIMAEQNVEEVVARFEELAVLESDFDAAEDEISTAPLNFFGVHR